MRKFVISVFLIMVIVVSGLYFWGEEITAPKSDVEEVSYEEIKEMEEIEGIEEQEEIDRLVDSSLVQVETDGGSENGSDELADEMDSDLPSEINLAVPFTPQAPFANWDLPYQEACEEASAYMVYLYYQGLSSGLVDATLADNAIWELVNFQEDYYGYYLDTTAQETADFIDAFYGLTTTVIEDPTVEQIKEELVAGRPVILPAAGQKLGNPFFSGEGPLYHMLVLRGYTANNQFITNDPGTRNGEGYVYDIDVIMEAMGDWNDGDPASGAKRVIFVAP